MAAEGTAAETPSDGVAMRSEPPTPNAQRNDPPKPPPIPVDRPDPTPTLGMTEKLDVDLRTDPRKDFEVHGPVEYTMGRLTLGPAGGVRRVLDVGSQARLALNLEFTPLREDGQTSTTRFAFQIRDRGEFVVLIVRGREKGKTLGELRLIDQDTPYGGRTARTLEKATQTLRAFTWQDDFADGPWTFRHHHGLLTVYRGNKQMGAGYADKELKHPLDDLQIQTPVPLAYRMFCAKCGIGEPLEVAGWSLEQQGVPVACREVSGTASPSYRKAMGGAKAFEAHLTGYRNELRGRIIGMPYHLRMRVDHPVQTDQAQIQDSGRSLEDENPIRTIRAWLGKRHPYVALALEGVGMQYHWAEKDAKAEELLTRAIQISEESLGPLHPDHASRLASLGRIYRERGQMDRAEPLLSQAKETALEVFGDKNGRYALALRDLALLYQDTGRIAEAETMLRRAVESCKDASPLDRTEVLPVLISLGELESRMGELEKAEGLLRQVETAYERFWKESRFRQPSETQEAFDKRSHVSRLIPVELAKGQTMLARKLLQDGQRAEARKLRAKPFSSWFSSTAQSQPSPVAFRAGTAR